MWSHCAPPRHPFRLMLLGRSSIMRWAGEKHGEKSLMQGILMLLPSGRMSRWMLDTLHRWEAVTRLLFPSPAHCMSCAAVWPGQLSFRDSVAATCTQPHQTSETDVHQWGQAIACWAGGRFNNHKTHLVQAIAPQAQRPNKYHLWVCHRLPAACRKDTVILFSQAARRSCTHDKQISKSSLEAELSLTGEWGCADCLKSPT